MQRQEDPGLSQPPEHSRRTDPDDSLEPKGWSVAEPHVDHGQGLQVH